MIPECCWRPQFFELVLYKRVKVSVNGLHGLIGPVTRDWGSVGAVKRCQEG